MKCWNWRRSFLWALVFCIALSVTGCTLEDAERNTSSVQQFSTDYGPIVPPAFQWIPAGISGVCGLALGIIGLIKEKRRTKAMKAAILTKADQIDSLINSTKTATDNPGNVVTKFMKIDTRSRPTEEKKDLHLFDAIRKGLV